MAGNSASYPMYSRHSEWPLFELTRKNVNGVMFFKKPLINLHKQLLINFPFLIFPNFSQGFVMETDVSVACTLWFTNLARCFCRAKWDGSNSLSHSMRKLNQRTGRAPYMTTKWLIAHCWLYLMIFYHRMQRKHITWSSVARNSTVLEGILIIQKVTGHRPIARYLKVVQPIFST